MVSPSPGTPAAPSDTPPFSFYKEKTGYYSAGISRVQKRLAFISLLRLISFSGLAIAGYFLAKRPATPLLFLVLFLFAGFVILVKLSLRLKDRRALLQQLLFVNTNELGVLNNE